ncbi:menaquinone biosynthetic enzyme MqnA/MqnD family protein [Calycomorphotria hydatis]|uniref:Chorismate dehydratase n=1 Tax=Calycomorphotria hydatis TaxID=2528027 RepID=A0A517TDT5_9PLAN|nr:menaquinone biosynthesis protein [Calycomorphotria hydatis]QDT66543.1 Chorismate dehydratase [Calycomorphotria hydatis]
MNGPAHLSPRIGAVSYLNSKPLIEGLADQVAEGQLVLDYPSVLADQLAAGELDVALIPVVEVLRNPEYEIVTDSCVAARGEVRSVKLFSRVPLGEVRSLALDNGSRTSAALARLMLLERYGIEPHLEQLPMENSTADSTADGILLIGDRAMAPPVEEFHTVWDLGGEWYQWTGLPFVFAVWATRRGVDLGPVERLLGEARDRGVEVFEQIAAHEAPLLGIPVEAAVTYLRDNLYFRLGDAERAGLKMFYQLCAHNKLIPEGDGLAFRHYRRPGQSSRRRTTVV